MGWGILNSQTIVTTVPVLLQTGGQIINSIAINFSVTAHSIKLLGDTIRPSKTTELCNSYSGRRHSYQLFGLG